VVFAGRHCNFTTTTNLEHLNLRAISHLAVYGRSPDIIVHHRVEASIGTQILTYSQHDINNAPLRAEFHPPQKNFHSQAHSHQAGSLRCTQTSCGAHQRPRHALTTSSSAIPSSRTKALQGQHSSLPVVGMFQKSCLQDPLPESLQPAAFFHRLKLYKPPSLGNS
jgi:hypothetical protein